MLPENADRRRGLTLSAYFCSPIHGILDGLIGKSNGPKHRRISAKPSNVRCMRPVWRVGASQKTISRSRCGSAYSRMLGVRKPDRQIGWARQRLGQLFGSLLCAGGWYCRDVIDRKRRKPAVHIGPARMFQSSRALVSTSATLGAATQCFSRRCRSPPDHERRNRYRRFISAANVLAINQNHPPSRCMLANGAGGPGGSKRAQRFGGSSLGSR